MTVAIIGAGIAGLTAAAALARIGIQAEVYERAHRFGEVGAGLQLSPNAVRPLHRLGLADALAAVSDRPTGVELRRWADGRLLGRTVLGVACERAYGAPYYTLRRSALHRALLGLLAPGVCRPGRHLVALCEHDDAVRLRFADGSTRTAELVVGADGIRSAVRAALTGDAAVPAGVTIHRGLIRPGRLPVGESRVRVWLGPGRHFVCYPVGDGGLSFVAAAPNIVSTVESWAGAGSVTDLLRAYAGWDPDLTALLAAADEVTRWDLHERPAPLRWHSRRLVLIGDAAHAMLPFGAQGAAQAIEDAVCLTSCLSDDAGRAGVDWTDALARYARLRMSRVGRVAAMTRHNADDLHLPDGPEQRDRDHMLATGRNLANQAWLYGHDAERLAVTA